MTGARRGWGPGPGRRGGRRARRRRPPPRRAARGPRPPPGGGGAARPPGRRGAAGPPGGGGAPAGPAPPAPAAQYAAGSRAWCRHCDQTLVYVSGVGWVNPAIGGAYDMCDGDPYANHDPH